MISLRCARACRETRHTVTQRAPQASRFRIQRVSPTRGGRSPERHASPTTLMKPISWIDAACELLCSGLVLYLPLAFGGVLAQSSFVLVLVGSALALLTATRLILAKDESHAPRIFLPIAGFLALALLQICPLPLELARTIAPANARILTDLASNPEPISGALASLKLSFYPHGTLLDVRILFALVATFAAAVQIYSKRAAIERLLLALSMSGSLVAALGVAQVITGAKGIYWTFPGGTYRSGPFVHYGHYAQFLNLSIGASLALLLARVSGRLGSVSFDVEMLVQDLRSPGRALDRWLAASIGLAIVAIGLSTSRNGLLSLCIAGALTVFVMHRRKFVTGLAWPAAALLLAATLTLFAFGFDPLIDRLGTLGKLDEMGSTRLALLSDTMTLWKTMPILGAGLGAFEYSFPQFDTSTRPGTAAHAENQYAEVLADVGILGFLFVAVVSFIVIRGILASTKSRDFVTRACAYGSAYALLAVGIHATTDFGLRIPAVAIGATLLAGLTIAIRVGRASTRRTARPASRIGLATLMTAIGVALAAQAPDAHETWRAQVAWNHATRAQAVASKARELPDSREFDMITELAESATKAQANDIDYAFWALAYRWQAAVAKAIENEEDYRTSEELKKLAQTLVPKLLELRSLAPTYGQLWTMAGQLARRYLGDERGADWIKRGFDLAPHHPATCLAFAELGAARGEDKDIVAQRFRRAMSMGARWERVLRAVLVDTVDVDLARLIAKGNAKLLYSLARQLEGEPQHTRAFEDVRRDALTIWAQQAAAGTIRENHAYLELGRDALTNGANREAITYLRQYLRKSFKSKARVDLAKALAAIGEDEDARRELRTALRYNPSNPSATRLLRQLQSKGSAK